MTTPHTNHPLPYPPTRQDTVVDNYHGTPVADPFRWLEDPNDPETIAWTQAEHALTRSYLDALPCRQAIEERLTTLWNFPRIETIHKVKKEIFFTKNSGLQNQSPLYVQVGDEGKPRLLLDPNTWSEDGTIALMSQYYSPSGRYLAYARAASGSDWQEINLLDTRSGDHLPDTLRWTKFASLAWLSNERGFYYNRLPEPGSVPPEDQNNYSRVYFHRLGSSQMEDDLVYERPEDKELSLSPFASDDQRTLYITLSHGTDRRNGVVFRRLDAGEGDFTPLIQPEEASFQYVGEHDGWTYWLTTLDAPNGRIIAVDLTQPARENWREVLPQGENAIENAHLVDGVLLVITLHHAAHRLQVFSPQGKLMAEPQTPALGTLVLLDGSSREPNAYLMFTSFLYPPTVLNFNSQTMELTTFFQPSLPFDKDAYQTTRAFYRSKDGTRVPIFLNHKKGMQKNGANPTILYGYGGFTLSQTPFFNVWNLVWLEMGGLFALANIRGGTEYGEAWHQAGMLENKQNVFDDFIAAAEWLIAEGYTRTDKLAIEGRSNGGLLVAACMLQRPDLFGAVLCHVPVTDMLRYHKFTVGRFWVPEYGNAETNPEHFRFLYAYSPLHNVKPGMTLPPILVTTADTDDRVVPSHSKKFVASLQTNASSDNPILLRVESKAGHKLGRPTYKIIAEHADIWAFACHTLGMDISGLLKH